MIRTFVGKETAAIFAGHEVRRFPKVIQQNARRKLLILDAAVRLEDMGSPPGNRLKTLKGKRKGQWSIRINDQWRICFRWRQGDAFDVEVTDYHDE